MTLIKNIFDILQKKWADGWFNYEDYYYAQLWMLNDRQYVCAAIPRHNIIEYVYLCIAHWAWFSPYVVAYRIIICVRCVSRTTLQLTRILNSSNGRLIITLTTDSVLVGVYTQLNIWLVIVFRGFTIIIDRIPGYSFPVFTDCETVVWWDDEEEGFEEN